LIFIKSLSVSRPFSVMVFIIKVFDRMGYQKNRTIPWWPADEHINPENSLVGAKIPRL